MKIILLNLALFTIATGSFAQSTNTAEVEAAPLYSSMKDAFTYVFQNQGGNWKIHSMSHAKLEYKQKKQ